MNRRLLLIVLLFAALLVGCRRLPYAGTPERPTQTPTPRSTPLPPVPSPIPVGAARNPIQLAIPAPDAGSFTEAAAELETVLREQTGLTIDVLVTENDGEALAALCDSEIGRATAAWLSGLAYVAAREQGCGTAALQVERGAGSSADTGDDARIIANRELGITEVSELADRVFCRLGFDSVYTWLVPLMILRAEELSVPADLRAVRDYADINDLFDDVVDGTCDAAGISGTDYDTFAVGSARSDVLVLAESAPIPYAVLTFPQRISPPQRAAIIAALEAVAEEEDNPLAELLPHEALVEAADGDFTRLRSFISGAGIDLAALAN